MKKFLGIMVLGLLWCNFINAANANIYWMYEFYKISPQSNIFNIGDSGYQECLKSQLSEKEYNKAIKFESEMSKKIEKTADTCVEKLLISQKNPVLQECLKNELNEERYNNLIINSFSKKPKKNDFKVFQKCLFNLKTSAADSSYNQSGSCPEGYILEDNSCKPDKSQKKVAKQKSNYNLNDPALNKCFKKMLGEERYQEVVFSSSQTPNNQENKSITECQKNPDYWSAGSYSLGYNTPDYYYDIFDGNKMENCISNPNPVFTHEITDFSKIKQLKRWGLTPQGYLKGHTYIFLKNKGHSGNRVIIKKPVPVYAPIDSHLILQTQYRLQGLEEVQWRLIFQVSCEIIYRFDHLDKPSDRILNHLGNISVNEDQTTAPNVAVNPPLKITAGEIIAYTKGTPQAGSWDFGVSDINKNNELPKRLKEYENKPAGRHYKYAACPYDYYKKDIKKKYLKKMKGKKCNPKEIK